VRHRPSCPFVIKRGSQSLKLPAIATSLPDGASRTKVTDFFVREGTRNPGLVAGGITRRCAVAGRAAMLLDSDDLGDPIVPLGLAVLLGFLILLGFVAAPLFMIPPAFSFGFVHIRY
jgi:hypothetical protein